MFDGHPQASIILSFFATDLFEVDSNHFKVDGDPFKVKSNHLKVDGDHFKVDDDYLKVVSDQFIPRSWLFQVGGYFKAINDQCYVVNHRPRLF